LHLLRYFKYVLLVRNQTRYHIHVRTESKSRIFCYSHDIVTGKLLLVVASLRLGAFNSSLVLQFNSSLVVLKWYRFDNLRL
jgi:hypothetical protein